jgi:hypothetical protein
VCGTISLPASIVSVSSGTSGHAPVQAFQRLHRGYLIRQFYCFRSSPRGLWSDGARRIDSLPRRGPMTNSHSKPQLCAVEPDRADLSRIRYCAVVVDRAPLTDRCRRTGLCHSRRTDISFAAASGCRFKSGGGDNSHSLFSPRNNYRKRKARSSNSWAKINFFTCTRWTFLTFGAVRWDTAAYNLWIM